MNKQTEDYYIFFTIFWRFLIRFDMDGFDSLMKESEVQHFMVDKEYNPWLLLQDWSNLDYG